MKSETMSKLKVKAEVNGRVYQSETNRIISSELDEQIDSCKKHIRQMLREDGFEDICPDYTITVKEGKYESVFTVFAELASQRHE